MQGWHDEPRCCLLARAGLCRVLPLALAALTALHCSHSPSRSGPESGGAPVTDVAVLSVVGTNDLHGALDRLPILGGYLDNLRAVRSRDGGVVLVDGGDMFQGTIESNSNEGAAVIDAYNVLGYTAATVGNHEFDFGPAGAAAVPSGPGDDPRGALKQRIIQASFPILAGNILDADSATPVDWPGVASSAIRRIADIDVGIIGVTTEETLGVTMAANVVGLAIAPLADTLAREAGALRRRGAAVVIVAAHAGGRCREFDDPDDLSSCSSDEEIMNVARALPPGSVDVIVGGHTHQAIAHRVNGIIIIESYSRGRAFGRADLSVSRKTGKVVASQVFAPRELCPGQKRVPAAQCRPGTYEGAPVTRDPAVVQSIAGALARAEKVRHARLGVEITEPVKGAYATESALGNLVVDLIREARPADVAVTNAGGLRAHLPAGPLTYGALYEVQPFDNRFATIEMRGVDLARIIESNLRQDHGILLLSGARATARCDGEQLAVTLIRDDGRPIRRQESIKVVMSDYLATAEGGPVETAGVPDSAITVHQGATIRDSVAEVLRNRGGTLSGASTSLFDPARLRVRYPMPRPVRCPVP